MDGAQAGDLFSTINPSAMVIDEQEGVRVAQKVLGVSQTGASCSADLGGSSKYSYETYED